MTGFEVFRRTAAPRSPHLTIRRGQLILNKSARTLIGSPETVELLFDQINRRVGIRAAQVARNGFRVQRASGGVSATAYLREYHLSDGCWPVVKSGDMIVAEVGR